MTEIAIRLARVDDLPLLAEMIHGLAAHHGDEASITVETLQQAAFGEVAYVTLLVAEMAQGVAGYCGLCPLAQLQFGVFGLDIHHLYVQPDLRGQGVGRALVEGALEYGRTRGCRFVTVGTHPDNLAAQAFYSAAGFSDAPQTGRRFRIRLD